MPRVHRSLGVVPAALVVVGLLVGCVPVATPTFFIPPTAAATLPVVATLPPTPGSGSTATAIFVPTVVAPSPTPPCINGLTYETDLTVPDGTNVAPGQAIDKLWQVKNSGTCNWDQRYRLKLISGDPMGVGELLPLYPARAGTEATLEIHFTAPQAAGLYECHWQAVDPDGQPFGHAFYMQISVTP
jgi:Ig-like domain from next to BRCA1 gene